MVSFVSSMTFYTFFGEEEGLLLIGHIHGIQFIVDDGLVSSCSFKSLFPRTPRACLPLPSAGLWAASVGANLSSTGTITATPLWV